MRRNFMLQYLKDTSFKVGSSNRSIWNICLFEEEGFNFQMKTQGQVSFKWRGVLCRTKYED